MLRHWLIGRLLNAHDPLPGFTPHRPPYLGDLPLSGLSIRDADAVPMTFQDLEVGAPREHLVLTLPGERVELAPNDAANLFQRSFTDIETQLAVYRFSWLPLAYAAADPAWVDSLWRAFMAQFPEPDDSWAWHPYTAAERGINILDFARRRGLPGIRADSLGFLARHADAIAARLEYFGDHNTSNHLSNNGRGLYRIGLALGLPKAIEIGSRILLAEARRIFRPSGILREGSAHYHLLLTRNYLDAYLAAREHDRPEAASLAEIARSALAVLPFLSLGGGVPLIGDISPDCPPDFLKSLLGGTDRADGWVSLLTHEERLAIEALREPPDARRRERLARDGWIRFADGAWSGLWHVPPDGWAPMPGHGHQDIGAFELHWASTPLVIDPGRGAYGETGEASFFVSAAAHSGLTIDGQEPYPPNKPYYGEAFRRRIGGPPPGVRLEADGISISFSGYSRLRSVGEVERRFTISDRSVAIDDQIAGQGRHRVSRRLYTPWPADSSGGSATIYSPAGQFRIEAEMPLSVRAARRWVAYGTPAPAFLIEAAAEPQLPARLRLQLKRLD